MKRDEILGAAAAVVRKRGQTYGDAGEMWRRIAAIWSVRTGSAISPELALSMMANVKQVRADLGALAADNYVDACGYEALAGECRIGCEPAAAVPVATAIWESEQFGTVFSGPVPVMMAPELAVEDSAVDDGAACPEPTSEPVAAPIAAPADDEDHPADAEPAPAAARKAPAAGAVKRELTEADKAEIVRLHGAGQTNREIAQALECKAQQVHGYLQCVVRKIGKAPAAGSADGAAVTPVHEPEEAPRSSGPVSTAGDASPEAVAERTEEPPAAPAPKVGLPAFGPKAHPADDGSWSLDEDLIVLRNLAAGVNSYLICQKLTNRKPADVVARFRQLVPRPGLTEQAAVLKRVVAAIAARDAASPAIAAE